MKQFLLASLAFLLTFSFVHAEEEQNEAREECRIGFLVLSEKIYTGCQISEIEYRYIDFERQSEVTGPLNVIEIVYPGDEQFARLESLMNLGRYEGLLMGAAGMQLAIEMGRNVGRQEGYVIGRQQGLREAWRAPSITSGSQQCEAGI